MGKKIPKEQFIEHKRKKKWFDKNKSCCFTLYPRSIYITWSHTNYWSWNNFKDTEDDYIEVAKLKSVCWLDVQGKLLMSELSPGVNYEIVYVVKLTKSASGWEHPVNLRLIVPGIEQPKIRQVSLLMNPIEEWFELNLGSFKAIENEVGQLHFDIIEHSGHWKSGLIIKSAIIRPKQ